MYVVIFITAPNKKEAQTIAQALIRRKLAACVNILAKVESLFWWQGKVDQTTEAMLIVKTKRRFLSRLIKQVKALHSYTCPEIIALPIVGGEKGYLDWIDASVKRGT